MNQFLHIISRATARNLGIARYFTGKPCKRGHIAARTVCDSICTKCSEYSPLKYQKNKVQLNEQSRAYYQANKQSVSIRYKQYYQTKRTTILTHAKQYGQQNKAKLNHNNALRRAKKLKAQPKWLTAADKQQIKQYYAAAQELTELTGIQFHVDHIIPLQGKNVSGLHIPTNLQLLTFYDNICKSNIYEEQTCLS